MIKFPIKKENAALCIWAWRKAGYEPFIIEKRLNDDRLYLTFRRLPVYMSTWYVTSNGKLAHEDCAGRTIIQ